MALLIIGACSEPCNTCACLPGADSADSGTEGDRRGRSEDGTGDIPAVGDTADNGDVEQGEDLSRSETTTLVFDDEYVSATVNVDVCKSVGGVAIGALDDAILVAWQGQQECDGPLHLLASWLTPEGLPNSDVFVVESIDPSASLKVSPEFLSISVAALPKSDRVLVAWAVTSSVSEHESVVLRSFAPNATEGSKEVAAALVPGSIMDVVATPKLGGGFDLLWSAQEPEEMAALHAQGFSDDLGALGEPVDLSPETGDTQFGASASRGPAGELLVTWSSSLTWQPDMSWKAVGRLFDENLATLSPLINLSAETEMIHVPPYPSALLTNSGEGYIVWEGPDVLARGTRIPLVPQVGEVDLLDLHAQFGAERYPILAPLGGGAMLLLWEGWAEEGGIHGRAINSDWAPLSQEFVLTGPDGTVDAWAMGAIITPVAVAAFGESRVAVAWEANRSEATGDYPAGQYVFAAVVP